MGKVARQVVEQAGVNVDVLLDKLVRAASAELGLASSVISIPGAKSQCEAARAIKASTVLASMRDGVPPPKKMLVSARLPVSAAK